MGGSWCPSRECQFSLPEHHRRYAFTAPRSWSLCLHSDGSPFLVWRGAQRSLGCRRHGRVRLPAAGVCVDYPVAGSTAAVLPRWATLALVAAVLAADALTSLGGIYYFLGADLLSAVQYLSALEWAPLLAATWPGAVAALAYMVATARRIRLDGRRSHRTAATLLLTAGLLTGLDTLNGTNALVPRGADRVATNVAGSALVLVGRLAASRSALAHATPVPTASATADLRAFLADASVRADGHILVVVVESWGVPRSPSTHATLIAPLLTADI